MLKLDQLILGYRTGKGPIPLLQINSLLAKAGELVAVIGKNGIGKSTLLRTLARIQPEISGEILLSGTTLRAYSDIKLAHRITYISASWIPVMHFTVFELVSLGRHPHTNWMGNLTAKDKEMIWEAIHQVDIQNLVNQQVSKISDGERQRVQIARALAQDTDVILLDEPTAFLDVGNRYTITYLLNKLCKEKGKTIVFSTHDWDVAIHSADKLWILHPGGVAEGAPEDLVLAGAFQNLFDNTSLQFNPDTGKIQSPKSCRGKISIHLQGIEKKWTESMLERLGFGSDPDASDAVSKSMDGRYQWNSKYGKENFENLYELANFLNSSWKK